MIWFILALIGAVFDATYYFLVKKLVKDLDEYAVASGVFLSAGLVLLLISIMKGVPQIHQGLWAALLGTVSINVIATILYLKALRITDLSLSIPMLSFSPIFLIFTSIVMLGEFPTRTGIIGILLIVIGSYVLNTTNRSTHILDPFRSMVNNKGIVYMLVVSFLFSIAANFDKLTVQHTDAAFGSALIELAIGSLFLIIALFRKNSVYTTYKTGIARFMIAGAVMGGISLATNSALLLQIVPYVVSVKRLSILFSVLFGALFFNEKHMLNKSIGALIMLAGVALILLF